MLDREQRSLLNDERLWVQLKVGEAAIKEQLGWWSQAKEAKRVSLCIV
jgi:hypothetical protein